MPTQVPWGRQGSAVLERAAALPGLAAMPGEGWHSSESGVRPWRWGSSASRAPDISGLYRPSSWWAGGSVGQVWGAAVCHCSHLGVAQLHLF